ncbi:ORC ubiquitin ligase 1 [Mixophyes fleayi]|uniref:ORC ubiquitin ligase 1 n=1 Tax=Mixophyes fleayi TaxID=3061075 RepID=UPI003F4E23AB
MAQNVQNVTIALTLPITCHICLGKVRQPVICVNYHVFCSVCIELWLKNNNQCPACRVPITPENPCKDIIGGTSENECVVSHSIRKHLRKTRLELLHKEYEDEIESLVKESEELKRTNLKLEEQLRELADPAATLSPCHCGDNPADDRSNISDELLVEWNRKLDMVNAANKKVTEDIEKLKEENKKLKNENIEFVRENLRLKNEVDIRSPQKFGRFTVAALQAKVDQYERETSRLKKALERSDQYIEEVEAQIKELKRPSENEQKENPECQNAAFVEVHANGARSAQLCAKANAGELFPNHNHKTGTTPEGSNSICSTSNGHAYGLNKAQSINGHLVSPELKTKVSGYPSTMLDASEQMHWDKSKPRGGTETLLQNFASPSSSLPFSSLQLNTPHSKAGDSVNHGSLKKPLTYLRKLVFDDLPGKRELGKLAFAKNRLNTGESTDLQESKPIFGNFCQNNCGQQKEDSDLPRKTDNSLQVGKQGANSADKRSVGALTTISGEGVTRTRTSSENSMDTAFHDKVTEFSYMMCDLEGQKIAHHGNESLLSPKQQIQSNSTIQVCKNSKKATLSHQAKSINPKTYGSHSPYSSSANENGKQSQFFRCPLPSDTNEKDFENNLFNTNTPCMSSSQPEGEVIFQPSSFNVALSGLTTESTCQCTCIPQSSNNSPPAKRKMLNPYNDSPSKSLKH